MKHYDLIYFAGDSWTVATNTDGVLQTSILETEGFPYLVSASLGVPYYKAAMGGAGNKWIHRTVYNDLPNLTKKYKSILSVVGWSHPERVEILCNKNKDIHNISSPPFSEEFYKCYMLESRDFPIETFEKETETHIKSVRSLYQACGIDYIDAFAFSKVLDIKFLGQKAKVLHKNYLDICGDEGRIYNPATNGYGHQNVLGNKKIADALVEAIKKHYG